MTDSIECIFCGRSWGGDVKHSWQHILGNRLHKHAAHLPNARSVSTASLLFDIDTQQFVTSPATEPGTRGSSLLNLQTHDVSEDCNTGWMRVLEEEATPLFLALADAARSNTHLPLSRTETRVLARRAQVIALTNELTAPSPRIGNSAMGTRLRDGDLVQGSRVWLARTQDDLGIQFRQHTISISPTDVVMPDDPESQCLLLGVSWFHLTLLVYIPEVPGRTDGPILPFDRWTSVQPCGGASGIEYPPMVPLSISELVATLSGQWWLQPVRNRGVRSA
jgi:hypothetical protein